MTEPSNQSTQDPRRARRMLILLALLFLAPVAIAFVLYYGASWRPQGETHHGVLADPPRLLPEASLPAAAGGKTPPDFLRRQWTLLYVGDGSCGAHCREALYVTRQVRLSLNQDMDRVQRVFLYSGECCEQPWFSAEQAGLIAANADDEEGRRVLDAVAGNEDAAVMEAGRIYVVDPLGNLVLTYEPGAEPKGMIADLKRLLKLSHIG
jgi:cytochrome oxidase Cu insertion factor (SCO1/SenC/PrrC family)